MPFTTQEFEVALVAGALLLGPAVWWSRVSARRWRSGALAREYFRRSHLPRALAEDSLAAHLARVAQRFPGKTRDWYLRWLLDELARDRR